MSERRLFQQQPQLDKRILYEIQSRRSLQGLSDPSISPESQGVKHLKSLQPIHIISLLAFLIVVIMLVILVKRYFVKFAQFYIVRRDYLRLNAPSTHQKSAATLNSEQTTKNTKIREYLKNVGLNFIQNMETYHPLASVVIQRTKLRLRIQQTPVSISLIVMLIGFLILLTISLISTQVYLHECDINRSSQNYICKMQLYDRPEIGNEILFGLSVIAAVIAVSITISLSYIVTKDYFRFIERLRQSRLSQSDGLRFSRMNVLNSQPDNHPTMQNMLAEDSECTRRSLNKNMHQPNPTRLSNKNLFQINEDEEEEPFSPSKPQLSEIQIEQISDNNMLGENRNILNTSHLINQSMIGQLQVPKTADCENQHYIQDLPQFNSYHKENSFGEDAMKDFTQKQLSGTYSQDKLGPSQFKHKPTVLAPRPHSTIKPHRYGSSQIHQNSIAGFSDSTTVLDIPSVPKINPNSSQKELEIEIIEEEQPGMLKSSLNQSQLKAIMVQNSESSKVQISQTSKDEGKEADSSRVFMMNQQKHRSDQLQPIRNSFVNQEETQTHKRMLIISIVMLIILCLLVMCIIYIGYHFYNITSSGLVAVLTIFGFGILVDQIILRPLTILIISLFSSRKQLSFLKQRLPKEIEEELCLLGDIYEDYELPLPQTNLNAFNSNQSLIRAQNFSSNIHDQSNNLEHSRKPLQEDIEQQQPQNQRVIKFNAKKKGYRGELMLVESTFFYHQHGYQKKEKQVQQDTNQLQAKQEIKRRKTVAGEKISVSGSLIFNAAEEMRFKKALTQGLHINDDDSNYDIEEIPIHSSRHQAQRDSIQASAIPQSQQFETPKGQSQQRIIFNLPGGLNASQQTITFNNEHKENDQKLLLKDLVMGSGSSQKKKSLKTNQEYQSLQRYLNDGDKENQNSLNKKGRESMTSSLRQQKYLEDNPGIISPNNEIYLNANEEVYKFTPQYSSLQKHVSRTKDSKRQSLAPKSEVFSDLKQVNLISQLQDRPRHSKKNSTLSKNVRDSQILSKHGSLMKAHTLMTGRKSLNSPSSSIKENLDHRMRSQMKEDRLVLSIKQQSQMKKNEIPNVSPFHENREHLVLDLDQTYIEPPTMNMPSPSRDLFQNSTDFNVINNNDNMRINEYGFITEPQNHDVRESANKNIRKFLQPQLMQRKSREKQAKKSKIFESQQHSSNENTKIPSKHNKNHIIKRKHQSQVPTVNDTQSMSDAGILCQQRINNDSRNDETQRSKIFEDSDTSTFRLISFTGQGSKQRSKKNLHSRQHSSQFQTNAQSESEAIDFYSNANSTRHLPRPPHAEVIVEEIATHHSSPERLNHRRASIIEIQDSNASFSSQEDDKQSNGEEYQDQESCQVVGLRRFDTEVARVQAQSRGSSSEDYQDLGRVMTRGSDRSKCTSQQNRQSRQKRYGRESSAFDTQQIRTVQDEMRKKREDQELLQLRIADQKRKLKHFLKLAQQLKSLKDEKKIRELLKQLKEKGPLPYSQIQELKQLEIMSSPYNQSLIDMIKDEYDRYKKGNTQKSKKPSKSQNRMSQAKSGQLISKLSGIYGSSRDSDSTFRPTARRDFKSRDSMSSHEQPPRAMFRKRRQERNQPLVIEGTQDSSFTQQQQSEYNDLANYMMA